jgi:hypothetical protein
MLSSALGELGFPLDYDLVGVGSFFKDAYKLCSLVSLLYFELLARAFEGDGNRLSYCIVVAFLNRIGKAIFEVTILMSWNKGRWGKNPLK